MAFLLNGMSHHHYGEELGSPQPRDKGLGHQGKRRKPETDKCILIQTKAREDGRSVCLGCTCPRFLHGWLGQNRRARATPPRRETHNTHRRATAPDGLVHGLPPGPSDWPKPNLSSPAGPTMDWHSFAVHDWSTRARDVCVQRALRTPPLRQARPRASGVALGVCSATGGWGRAAGKMAPLPRAP